MWQMMYKSANVTDLNLSASACTINMYICNDKVSKIGHTLCKMRV